MSIISLTINNLYFLVRPTNEYLKLLKEVVCYNQGAYTEYAYVASEKHKELKEEYGKPKTRRDAAKLQQLSDSLVEHLDGQLNNVLKENFQSILKYFDGRSRIDPRVCVKVYDNDSVIALKRDRMSIPNRQYPIDANTAFQTIYETGGYYFCNDIPTAFLHGQYRNARINEMQARLYAGNSWIRRKLSIFNENPDEQWMKCWEPSTGTDMSTISATAETCYKSTLVIPMTLINNTVSVDFKKQFNIDKASPKTIYGFLCFDSHLSGYFNEKQDLCIGYIFADILSLYLISRLVYTEFSNTFRETQILLGAQAR